MLGDGEFDKMVLNDGTEVWVTLMGPYLNMNTAFIDRDANIVAIVDPFDASRWREGLLEDGLEPTHLLYTHTHRDHASGYQEMMRLFPRLEVWGHEDARVPDLLGHPVFERVDFTNTWAQPPLEGVEWKAGRLSLSLIHI